ncbi:Ppx/GppA phosphatase family protein [Peptostreptococcus canis]|uniref:Ppx/GppA family phosphatase n=1 Tax=Peptostreptococcus canis TaxID=1159213 RepID=A0ABR6TLP4_9FIRM|nr:Ppx/GppA phosphatase family protein [Peptostreptococcus canis]MBC2576330.1 Ppx/GppA family phosphatase [Peptostreptococcus canis]MBP1998529.1 exopolyphosphatase/guanosine-5'-triphosphate,3'-diphosphate pyrophosphatase [Peptostreptococcus canis]
MKYGIIDIGTNSMRLLLADFDGKNFNDRTKMIETTRLGRGIDETGKISVESIKKSVETLAKFKKITIEYCCDKIVCIGTAALRCSANKEEFIKIAKEKTGIDVEIISGDTEALLGYKGVTGGIELFDQHALIIDIGGGSTEFIVGNAKNILFRESIDIGALRLTDTFVNSFPENEMEIKNIVDYIQDRIKSVIIKIKSLKIPLILIGIGGTITSVSAINQKLETYSMEKIHSSKVSYEELENQINFIKSMNIGQRRKIVGLQPKRAEIILSGELILKEIMKNIEINEIVISEYDNLEGCVFDKTINKSLKLYNI